ncbi:MAG: hypothetical protein J6Y06_09530 [Bacteroidales bacterium]|nr:hypothetical protein [Bacteroidales bacterium]
MKKIVLSIGSVVLIALLAILGLNIYSGRGPREKVKAPDGSKVVVEELSYYIHGGKVFGKVYKPDDGDASARRPLVVYFHEPLKTDFPESVLKALVSDGLAGYATGFRGKDSDAVSIVKRLSREEFAEKDMVFLVSDAYCADNVLLAASRLGHRIQGLILLEPNPTGKAREIYQIYGKEFLSIDSSQKGNAVALIENYLEERGALK